MVEADYLNFTVESEMQSWRQEVAFHLAAVKRAGVVHNGDLPKLFDEAALVPKGHLSAHAQNMVCEVAVAEAKECRQRLQSVFEKTGADTADTIGYVLVGAPRNLVSVDGEHSVDLAIYSSAAWGRF